MDRTKTRSLIGIIIGLAMVAGMIAGIVALVGAQKPSENKSKSEVLSHGTPITTTRTVLVSSAAASEISQAGQPLRVTLVSGSMPRGSTMATVTSDENCDPDAAGVSHCRNRIRLDGGTEITVVHPHRMSEVPCLAPGERVSLRPA